MKPNYTIHKGLFFIQVFILAGLAFAGEATKRATNESGSGFVPICERSRPIREYLELTLGESCAAITIDQRNTVKKIDLTNIVPGPLQAGDFSGLQALQEIVIRDFELTSLPAGLFTFLPSLTDVDLRFNKLTEIRANVFGKGGYLQILRLGNNPIEKIDLNLDAVDRLEVSSPRFTSTSFHSDRNISVKTVYLYSDAIVDLDLSSQLLKNARDVSLNVPNLREFRCNSAGLISLHLYSQLLEELTMNTLQGCPALKSFLAEGGHFMHEIDKAKLHNIALNTFDANSELETIIISDFPQLKNLPEGLFDHLPALMALGLARNGFDSKLNRIFRAEQSITSLALDYNKFDYVPSWFADLNSNILLYLRGNPLNDNTRTWLKKMFANIEF